ncbi:unnamed protein product, partial [Closterium sp. NIES-53]
AHGVCVCVLCCQVATSMRSPPPSPPSPPSLHCPSLPPELGVQGPWCMCVRTVLPSCHQHALSSPLTPLSPLSSLPLSPPRAGRAGPMVYAVAYCAASTKHRVARMGFADSKTLTEARREQLFRVMGGPATAAPSGRDNGGSGGDGSSVIVDGGNGNGKGGNGSKAEGVSVAGRDGGEKAEQAGSASAAAGVSVAAAAGGAGEGAGAAEEASVIGWEVDVINAAALSAQMLSRERTSLNAIAFESTAKLIQRVLDQGVNIVEPQGIRIAAKRWHHPSNGSPRMRITVVKRTDNPIHSHPLPPQAFR